MRAETALPLLDIGTAITRAQRRIRDLEGAFPGCSAQADELRALLAEIERLREAVVWIPVQACCAVGARLLVIDFDTGRLDLATRDRAGRFTTDDGRTVVPTHYRYPPTVSDQVAGVFQP